MLSGLRSNVTPSAAPSTDSIQSSRAWIELMAHLEQLAPKVVGFRAQADIMKQRFLGRLRDIASSNGLQALYWVGECTGFVGGLAALILECSESFELDASSGPIDQTADPQPSSHKEPNKVELDEVAPSAGFRRAPVSQRGMA